MMDTKYCFNVNSYIDALCNGTIDTKDEAVFKAALQKAVFDRDRREAIQRHIHSEDELLTMVDVENGGIKYTYIYSCKKLVDMVMYLNSKTGKRILNGYVDKKSARAYCSAADAIISAMA